MLWTLDISSIYLFFSIYRRNIDDFPYIFNFQYHVGSYRYPADIFDIFVHAINIDATNLKVILNAKKARKFSPSARIRKIWIPKQYLTYKNDLATRGKVSTTR